MLTMLKERFDLLAGESSENLQITRDLAGKFADHLVRHEAQDGLIMIHDRLLRGDGNGTRGLVSRLQTIEQERKQTGIRSLGLQGWLMVWSAIAAAGGGLGSFAVALWAVWHH
jgi:hypothetical protein